MQTKIKSKIASSGNIYIQHCVYNIQHAPAVQQSWNTRITNTCQLSVCQGQYQSLNDNTLWAYPNKISYFNGIYFMSGKEYVLFMLWIKCLPLTLPSVLNKAHFLTPTSNFEKAKRKAKMKHYCTGKSRLSALGLTSPRGFLEIYKKKKFSTKRTYNNIDEADGFEHFQHNSNLRHGVFKDFEDVSRDTPIYIEELDHPLRQRKSVKLLANWKDIKVLIFTII